MADDSMQMGYIFEDLIRRFAEQSNETAGEHFTQGGDQADGQRAVYGGQGHIHTGGIVKTLYDQLVVQGHVIGGWAVREGTQCQGRA